MISRNIIRINHINFSIICSFTSFVILPTVFPSHESAIAMVDDTLDGRGKSKCVLSSSVFCFYTQPKKGFN